MRKQLFFGLTIWIAACGVDLKAQKPLTDAYVGGYRIEGDTTRRFTSPEGALLRENSSYSGKVRVLRDGRLRGNLRKSSIVSEAGSRISSNRSRVRVTGRVLNLRPFGPVDSRTKSMATMRLKFSDRVRGRIELTRGLRPVMFMPEGIGSLGSSRTGVGRFSAEHERQR